MRRRMDDFFPFIYISEQEKKNTFEQISLQIEEAIVDSIEKLKIEEEKVAIIEVL